MSPALHVQLEGSGPDLVLLHGWGFDHRVWGTFAQGLTRHFCVHRLDLPSHGESHATPFGSLDDAVARIAGHVPAGATVCGWSLGGTVALRLALSDPARVGKLVLIGATPCFVARGDWDAGMPASPFADFRQRFITGCDPALRRFAGLVAAGSADYRERHRELASMTTAAGPNATGLEAALAALLETDLRPDLPSLAPPALVVHGGRDGLVPLAAARWLASHLGARDARGPRARLELLPDASHAPFLDAPGRVASLISAWHG